MKKTKRLLNLFMILTFAFSMLLTTGCSNTNKNTEGNTDENIDSTTEESENPYITKTSFKLNTVVTITIYDKQEEYLLDESMDLCDYYEQLFSRTLETSELYQYNHGLLNTSTNETYTAALSQETIDLINAGLYYCDLSQGAFDITVAPLAELWNFSSSTPKAPTKEEIEALLPYIDYTKLSTDGHTATLENTNMAIDLGAIAKGYIADRIKEYLEFEGVKSAMINLGGNVLCVGEKPDGSAFRVGIQKPFADRNETIAIMDLKDVSVVSSGIYERYFEENGVFYHHILNPSTGYPYESNLTAVTIISKKSVDGDGLSTTCFALGLEDGLALINSLEDTYAIFITDDYELHYSDGFFDNITVTNVETESN